MTISAPDTSTLPPYPETYSDRPFGVSLTLGVDFQLNDNITLAPIKGSNTPINHVYRSINCRVTDNTDAAIAYIDYWGRERIYYAFYDGIHPIMGRGIVNIGAGISSADFQVLI